MAERAHTVTILDTEDGHSEKGGGDGRLEVIEAVDNEEGRRITRDGVEESFAFMVGTYAIRPFLRKLDDFAAELEGRRLEEARKRWDECLDQLQGRGTAIGVKEWMRRVETCLKGLRKSMKKKTRGLSKRVKKGKRELCFGEIESGEDLPRYNDPMVRRNAMKEELLWYYGHAGVLIFQARQEAEGIMGNEKVGETQRQVCDERSLEKWGCGLISRSRSTD